MCKNHLKKAIMGLLLCGSIFCVTACGDDAEEKKTETVETETVETETVETETQKPETKVKQTMAETAVPESAPEMESASEAPKGDPNVASRPVISLNREEQYGLNIYLSNFVEQSFMGYDSDNYCDDPLVKFAMRFTKINNPGQMTYDQQGRECVSRDVIVDVVDRFFGKTLTVTEGQHYSDLPSHLYDVDYVDGMFRAPGADGEFYGYVAVADFVLGELDGSDDETVFYSVYEMNMDDYMQNNGSVPSDYYYMTKDTAAQYGMTYAYSGIAVVRKNDPSRYDSYHLQHFEIDYTSGN